MPTTYRQFCPVARACEIVAERWTPLILRELFCGSTRFNQLKRGMPAISPSLLARRLRELELHGIIERTTIRGAAEYHLTRSGEDLRPIIEALGNWGMKWIEQDFTGDELDPALLVWDMHRRVDSEALPDERVVAEIDFRAPRTKRSKFWMIFEKPTVEVCFTDPGHEPSLYVAADLRSLADVWMGLRSFPSAIADRSLVLDGPRELCRRFPAWFQLSLFAGQRRAS